MKTAPGGAPTGRSRSAAATWCSSGLTSGASASLSARHSCCTHLHGRAGPKCGMGRGAGGGCELLARRAGGWRRQRGLPGAHRLGAARGAVPARPAPRDCKGPAASPSWNHQGPACTAARTHSPAGCPSCPLAPALQHRSKGKPRSLDGAQQGGSPRNRCASADSRRAEQRSRAQGAHVAAGPPAMCPAGTCMAATKLPQGGNVCSSLPAHAPARWWCVRNSALQLAWICRTWARAAKKALPTSSPCKGRGTGALTRWVGRRAEQRAHAGARPRLWTTLIGLIGFCVRGGSSSPRGAPCSPFLDRGRTTAPAAQLPRPG